MKRVPWLALAVLLGGILTWAVLAVLPSEGPLRWLPCPLKRLTGLPCLSCGMTRCLTALAEGDLSRAWHWHPVGLLGVFLLPWLGLWDLVRAMRGSAYPALPERPWTRWAVAGALAGIWCLQVVRGI